MAATTSTSSHRCSDEAAWDLLRDEWDLLLAVGVGPTGLDAIAARVGEAPANLVGRIDRLTRNGLLSELDGGWGLVPVVYERQEAMSSYVRDLVLDRVAARGSQPVELVVTTGTGDASRLLELHSEADATVLSQVVEIASVPEPDDAERFIVVFAATTLSVSVEGSAQTRALDGLRGAALQRARGEASGLARMWVAEMRVSPDAAMLIGERLVEFVGRRIRTSFGGTLVAAVWAVSGTLHDEVDS